MFSELVVSAARRGDKRKRWALVVSAGAQAGCLLVLILIPLIYTQALPKAILKTVLVSIPGFAAQPAAPEAPVRSAPRSVRLLNHNVLIAPRSIPRRVSIIVERELPPEEPAEGPLTSGSGVDLLNMAPVPAERVSRPAAPPSVPQRVPVTSTIEEAKLIWRVQPIYPPIAIQAHIQGNVVLHAIISKGGGVSELQVLSGHPLLVNAALEAVRQWRYSPTLLSGQPVEVETTITVSFVLGQ
jgi:periplasmic protein TonB